MALTRQREPATWELVLKRNSVERLKREKSPPGILAELPALIAAGYERIAEEDVVRLKWWGLYHDKPKVGTFMLRIKLPAGRAEPRQLRTIGELSVRYGRNAGEFSTSSRRSASRPPARAATPSATSPAARSRASTPTSSSTSRRCSTR